MPLFGTLKTMALPDLLQWLATARMTGTLQIERNKVSKSIILENGEVIGCSSDDPPELLGHFLLARGKISEDQLRAALEAQEQERKHLGMLLVEMGALSPDELSAHLEAKAEETIYSLFDWQDAVFRFQQGESDKANIFPVSLRVEDVLLRGLRRFDEMQRIREVFDDPGIILQRTGKLPPREVFDNRMAWTLYESIDGERSVAGILLHVHGSEFTVTKFLFELHRNGYVEIIGRKPDAADAPASAEPCAVPASPTAEAESHAAEVEAVVATLDAPAATVEAPAITVLEEAEAAAPELAQIEAIDESDAYQLSHRLEKARRLLSSGEYDGALDLLDELYSSFPGDESLKRLTAEAEAAFVEQAYRHCLPPSRIPLLKQPIEELISEKFSPSEFFLLSRIDGIWDVKSIIQIAPLREVDALRTLRRLREAGVIELREEGEQ
jgi:hypothetical protein